MRKFVAPNSTLFKVIVWIGSTLLSIGIVYGSVQTKIDQLEKQDQAVLEKLDKIDQKTDGLPLIKELLLQHMRDADKVR